MIGYLRGLAITLEPAGSGRFILVLEVQQVGYELQVTGRMARALPLGEPIQVFTHLQTREDQLTLYGFAGASERDLFRQLLAVNGVGPQASLALLDTWDLPALVQAIVTGDARSLSRAPGVGVKTAQRIALELKGKLRLPSARGTIPDSVRAEVEISLEALGYESREVSEALEVLGSQLSPSTPAEGWIREAISWLSRG